MIRKIKKPNIWFFLSMQSLFIIGFLLIMHLKEPNVFKIGVISDINQTELRALNLYRDRLNKYGGVDNQRLELVVIRNKSEVKSDFIATLNIKGTPFLLLENNKTIPLTRELETTHLNYRMSAIISDCLRKFNLDISQSALNRVKGLDVIIESLPSKIKSIKDTQQYLNNGIESHRYFISELEGKNPLIVHTAIAMNKIYNIDMIDVIYTMDFYIWFRWNGNDTLKPYDIEFINMTTPSFLIDPNSSISILSSSKVEDINSGDTHYRKYRVVANFKGLEHKNYVLGEQNLPIRFRHRNAPIEQLHYIYDKTDTSRGIFNQELPTTQSDWQKVKYNVIDNSSLSLNYTLPYSTFEYDLPLGNPLNLNGNSIMSEFTMRYAVKYIQFSFRGIEGIINGVIGGQEGVISIKIMLFYLLGAITVFIWINYIRYFQVIRNRFLHVIWFFKFINVVTIILCSEFLISQIIFDLKHTVWGYSNLDKINNMMQGLEFTMSTILWLFPAYYLVSALEQFVYEPIEDRTQTEIPKILKLFVSAIIYVLAFIGILAYVFEVTTSSLMATSGVFAILFAILSKVDLTNIVSGLGISFSGIIKIGEWVRIGDKEGEIVEMTARSTKIRTFDNSIINIPNSDVGTSIIENLGKDAYRLFIHLEVVPTDYLMVERVLQDSTYYTDGVLHTPKPFVAFLGQGDSAQIFEVYFFIGDYSMRGIMIDRVWRSVWKACEDNKIIMSTPQREHYNYEMKS